MSRWKFKGENIKRVFDHAGMVLIHKYSSHHTLLMKKYLIALKECSNIRIISDTIANDIYTKLVLHLCHNNLDE